MLNVTLEESDCFAAWMVLEDVPDLELQDPSRGKISIYLKNQSYLSIMKRISIRIHFIFRQFYYNHSSGNEPK